MSATFIAFVSKDRQNWVKTAEEALLGTVSPGVDVLRGRRPRILDSEGRRAIVVPFLAMFFWSVTAFRELSASGPLDPITLVIRFVAVLTTLRAVFGLVQWSKRIAVWLRAKHYALVLTNDGLLFRDPNGDIAVLKEHVIAVVEEGDWKAKRGDRYAHVFIVESAGSPRAYVSLPPVFDETPGLLRESIMRWAGTPTPREPQQDCPGTQEERYEDSRTEYDQLAHAKSQTSVAFGVGNRWLSRGPYAAVAFGIALSIGFARVKGASIAPNISSAVLILMPLVVVIGPVMWLFSTRSELRRRLGVAMIITSRRVLFRTRSTTTAVALREIQRLDIVEQTRVSVLEGVAATKLLRITRKNAAPITYDQGYADAPLEVIRAHIDHAKRANA